MNVRTAFKTDAQLAKACYPRMRSLYHPTMATETVIAFNLHRPLL